MPQTVASGVRIRYSVLGTGDPVVLIHGYSGSAHTNWQMSGWLDALAPSFRVVAPDLRGHGRSQKPWTRSAYSLATFAADVLAVMDAEDIPRARVFGYSMGGLITLHLLLEHRHRLRSAVVGAMGTALPNWLGRTNTLRLLERPGDPAVPRRVLSPGFVAGYLRHLDPVAQSAVYRGIFRTRPIVPVSRLGEIDIPVLCAVGSRDQFGRGARDLAGRIPGARLAVIPGRSHLGAIADPRLKQTVLDFFAAH